MARRPLEPAELARQLRALADALERGGEVPTELRGILGEVAPAAETSWDRRIRLGMARGLTYSQAAGKPRPEELPASQISGRPLQGAAREALSVRTPRGHWSSPTPGGTRDMRTRGRQRLLRELRRAAREGQQVIVAVEADEVEFGEYDTRRHHGDSRAYTGRTDPDALLQVIDAHDGDVDAAVAYWLETHENTHVEGVREYTIKTMER